MLDVQGRERHGCRNELVEVTTGREKESSLLHSATDDAMRTFTHVTVLHVLVRRVASCFPPQNVIW